MIHSKKEELAHPMPATTQVLAKKFAALYFLLEDLLSPAKHYDWGLRAIKQVLLCCCAK